MRGVFIENLATELDLLCITDDGRSFATELQTTPIKHYERRVFHHASLKARSDYGRIKDTSKSDSKYATLQPMIALNILTYTHFNVREALHYFRLYDVEHQKYTTDPHRYTEVYFEVNKKDEQLSDNLKQWQYFFQTGETLANAPAYIKEWEEMLLISNLSKEERRMYEIYDRNVQDQIAREAYARDEGEVRGEVRGEARGIERGAMEKAIRIAKKLFHTGMGLAEISDATDLSIEDLQKLARS